MGILDAKIGSLTGLIVLFVVFMVTTISQGFFSEIGKKIFEILSKFLSGKRALINTVGQATKEVAIEIVMHIIFPGIFGIIFIYTVLYFFGNKIGITQEKWIPLIIAMVIGTIITIVFSASYFIVSEGIIFLWRHFKESLKR